MSSGQYRLFAHGAGCAGALMDRLRWVIACFVLLWSCGGSDTDLGEPSIDNLAKRRVTQAAVFATDPDAAKGLKDSLTQIGYRVIVSSIQGESAEQVAARLPWLLQPGVDELYIEKNQGTLKDSLLSKLLELQPAAPPRLKTY